MTDYRHEVFVSYKRDPVHERWLKEHFIPLFSSALCHEIAAQCGRQPADIFFDQSAISEDLRVFSISGIEPGEKWRDALRAAIRTSRCGLMIWSPLYFHSEWCKIEWRSFELRAKQAKRELLVPLSVHDGRSFPKQARDSQIMDFADYVIIGGGYKETALYVDFQRQVRLVAQRVALVIKESPAFCDWPIAEENDPLDSPTNSTLIPFSRL